MVENCLFLSLPNVDFLAPAAIKHKPNDQRFFLKMIKGSSLVKCHSHNIIGAGLISCLQLEMHETRPDPNDFVQLEMHETRPDPNDFVKCMKQDLAQ